jgi:hypothetical protein
MEAGDGIIGEQGVRASDEGQVVAEVVGGLREVHGEDGVAGGDAVVESGE